MAELAESQGGSDVTAATKDGDKVDRIVGILEKRLTEFGQAVKSVKTLTEAVSTLRKDVADLKRQNTSNENDNDKIPPKKTRTAGTSSINLTGSMSSPPNPDPQQVDLGNDTDSSEDEWGEYFDEVEEQKESEEDPFQELESFFEEETETGANISEQLACIVDKGLRGKKDNAESDKLKDFKDLYKRPANVANLQVPKVDDTLWRQLKQETKSADFLHQRAISNYNFNLVPILRALDALIKDKDLGKAQKHLMDAVKIACLTIKTTNAVRAEKIRKEIQPRYKGICDAPPTADKLFGADFADNIKKVDNTKVNLTISSQQPFLGKKGGGPSNNHSNQMKSKKRQNQGNRTNPYRQHQQKKQSGHHRQNQQHYQQQQRR